MSTRKLPHKHRDRSLRMLFSHARLVRDLLRGFVREPWVAELDFSTLEQLPSDYVSGQLAGEFEERAGDVVWRVNWQGKDLYLVILLELQSTCEQDMALRVLVYLALFYQRLTKERPLKQGDLLPPAVPLVFYNGNAKWWAPLDVSELIEPVPPSFAGYLPSLRYCLIDEKRWPLDDLEAQHGNVAAGIARVEQDHGPDYLVWMVGEFHQWLDRPRQGALRRDLLAWLSKSVFPARAPGLDVPELRDLYEFKTYLEAKMQTWPEQWEAKGVEKGLRMGREEGQKEGEAAVLLRQLGLKFGPPDEEVLARIRSADSNLLLRWAERLLSAETLDDVFRDGPG